MDKREEKTQTEYMEMLRNGRGRRSTAEGIEEETVQFRGDSQKRWQKLMVIVNRARIVHTERSVSEGLVARRKKSENEQKLKF